MLCDDLPLGGGDLRPPEQQGRAPPLAVGARLGERGAVLGDEVTARAEVRPVRGAVGHGRCRGREIGGNVYYWCCTINAIFDYILQ